MDQLASVGVDFDDQTIARIHAQSTDYYLAQAAAAAAAPPPSRLAAALRSIFAAPRMPWAAEHIYTANTPVRPWALGALRKAGSFFYRLAGRCARRPGLYHRIDPHTGAATPQFLEDTGERVHASVRARLAAAGLGLDDAGPWANPALARWRLRRADDDGRRDSGVLAAFDAPAPPAPRWVWVYDGPAAEAPPVRVLPEDELGVYERRLLGLSGGKPNVLSYAEQKEW